MLVSALNGHEFIAKDKDSFYPSFIFNYYYGHEYNVEK